MFKHAGFGLAFLIATAAQASAEEAKKCELGKFNKEALAKNGFTFRPMRDIEIENFRRFELKTTDETPEYVSEITKNEMWIAYQTVAQLGNSPPAQGLIDAVEPGTGCVLYRYSHTAELVLKIAHGKWRIPVE